VRVGVPGQRAARSKRVQQGKKRKRLAEFLAGAPQNLAAQTGRVCLRRAHQLRFADAGLTLDQNRTPAPSSQFGNISAYLINLGPPGDSGGRVQRLGHWHQPIATRR